jgi:hypothetical protein
VTRLERLSSRGEVLRPRWMLHLQPIETTIIEGLPDQIASLLADPACNRRVIERLFPSREDARTDEEADRIMLGSSLLDSRKDMLAAFQGLLSGAERDQRGMRLELEAGGMDLVLRFANDVRMILATDLGVEQNLEEEAVVPVGHPDAPKWALLEYLGGLEALLLDALSREM